jgi:hypothetical protein
MAHRNRAESSTHWNECLPAASKGVGPKLATVAHAYTPSKLYRLAELPYALQ